MRDMNQLRQQVQDRWGGNQQAPAPRAYGTAAPNNGASQRRQGGSKGGPRPSGPVGGQRSAKGGTPMSGYQGQQQNMGNTMRSAKGGTPMSGPAYGAASSMISGGGMPQQPAQNPMAPMMGAGYGQQGQSMADRFAAGQAAYDAQYGPQQGATQPAFGRVDLGKMGGGFASSGSFAGPSLNVTQPGIPSGFSMGGGNTQPLYGPQQPMVPQIQGNPNMRQSPVDTISPFATYAKR